MAHPSKEKGKRFERELAALLTDAFGEPFQRVPASGAFTGGKNRGRMESMSQGQIQASRGDLIPPDSMPGLVIEAKHYAKVGSLIEGRNRLIEEWWAQATADARPGELVLLIVKQDRQAIRVFFEELENWEGWLSGTWISHQTGGVRLISAPLTDLLANCAPLIRERAAEGPHGAAQGHFNFGE